jgi:hypothetical protein
MIVRKYYAIYVEVPSGHPGVECFILDYEVDISEFIKNLWTNKSYAVIGVTKGV